MGSFANIALDGGSVALVPTAHFAIPGQAGFGLIASCRRLIGPHCSSTGQVRTGPERHH